MKVRIQIDTETFVRFWLVVIGFALAALLLYTARTALIIIAAAAFMALALNAPVTRLAKLMPGHSRVGGTALAFFIVVAFLTAVVFLVVPPIVQQTAKFISTVPGLIDGASEQWKGANNLIDHYNLRPQVDNVITSIKDNATSWAGRIGSNLVSGIGSIASVITSGLLVLVLSFLMLIEGPTWMKRIWGLYEDADKMRSHRAVTSKMYHVVSRYVTGQLTVSAIGATLSGIVVFILSFIFKEIPADLAFTTAAITFVLSLVPMFGATIAGVLIAGLLALNNLGAAIAFVVFFVIYQQIENNFVSPVIQSKSVELSALMVLVAVTIGLYMFGLAGGIISIPIAGCIKVLLEEYLAHAKRQREKSDKPMAKLVKRIQKEA